MPDPIAIVLELAVSSRKRALPESRLLAVLSPAARRRESRRPALLNGACWVFAIALLGLYCGLRSYEPERRAAITALFRSGGTPIAAELSLVEPTGLPAPDAQH